MYYISPSEDICSTVFYKDHYVPTGSIYPSATGPRFNIKTVFPGMDFHYKDDAIVRPSSIHNGNPCTDKTEYSYWNSLLNTCGLINRQNELTKTQNTIANTRGNNNVITKSVLSHVVQHLSKIIHIVWKHMYLFHVSTVCGVCVFVCLCFFVWCVRACVDGLYL